MHGRCTAARAARLREKVASACLSIRRHEVRKGGWPRECLSSRTKQIHIDLSCQSLHRAISPITDTLA